MSAKTYINMITKAPFLLCLYFLFSCSKPSSDTIIPTPTIPVNSIEEVISDMQGLHEATPLGVPVSFTWQAGPRVGLGNNPGTFKAVQPGGQIFETSSGNTSTNTRVELRNLKAYYLSKATNSWKLWIETPRPGGVKVLQDLTTIQTKAADFKDITGGGISVGMEKGYNLAFFAPSRTSIVPSDITGVFITVQARLIVEDQSKPDDRDASQFILSSTGEYWLDLTSSSNNFTNNGDIAIGKFKRITRNWRAFNMHTLGADELRKNPPPLE